MQETSKTSAVTYVEMGNAALSQLGGTQLSSQCEEPELLLLCQDTN